MKQLLFPTLVGACLFGIVASAHDVPEGLDVGSNEMLRAPISGIDGIEGVEVIVSDVILPPHAELPPHTHPGQEFVYVLEGEVLHREEGKPDKVYKAGDAFVIETGVVHSPVNGDVQARAIVFRVHPDGMPERTMVDQ